MSRFEGMSWEELIGDEGKKLIISEETIRTGDQVEELLNEVK